MGCEAGQSWMGSATPPPRASVSPAGQGDDQEGSARDEWGTHDPARVRDTSAARPRPPLPARPSGCPRSSSASRPASSGSRAGWARSQAHSWPGSPSSSASAPGLAPPRLAGAVSCGRLRTLVARARRTWTRDGAARAPGLPPPSLREPLPGRAAPAPRGAAAAWAGPRRRPPFPSPAVPTGKMVPSCLRALLLLPLLLLACPASRASQVSALPPLASPARPGPDAKSGSPGLTACGAWSRFTGFPPAPRLSPETHRGAGRLGRPGLVPPWVPCDNLGPLGTCGLEEGFLGM